MFSGCATKVILWLFAFVVNANLSLAILRYAGAPDEEPDGSTNSTATDLLREEDLHVRLIYPP